MIASLPSHATLHFVERKVPVKGYSYRYQAFVPNGWTSKRTWPAVLFLHGSSERGSDNQKQMSQGLPPWLKEHGANFPAVAVIPQASEDHYWTGDVEQAVMQALEGSI